MRLTRKEWQRQQAEIACDEAMTLDGLEITRLPTFIDLRCVCGRNKRVEIPAGKPRPRFRCSRCGALVR